MSGEYEKAFRESVSDPERFWGAAAENVQWYRPPDRVLSSDNPPFYRWFEGGVLNSCYNALDYHVENGRGDRVALIYDSPVTKTVKRYTYTGTPRSRGTLCRWPAATGCCERRPRGNLHADDPGSGHRDACLCPYRRHPLSSLWRFCRTGTCSPHRGCKTPARHFCIMRD